MVLKIQQIFTGLAPDIHLFLGQPPQFPLGGVAPKHH